jgi:hypothetical protein
MGGAGVPPMWQANPVDVLPGQQRANAVVWMCGRKATKVCFPFGLVVHTGGLKTAYLLVTSHLILVTYWLTLFCMADGP